MSPLAVEVGASPAGSKLTHLKVTDTDYKESARSRAGASSWRGRGKIKDV